MAVDKVKGLFHAPSREPGGTVVRSAGHQSLAAPLCQHSRHVIAAPAGGNSRAESRTQWTSLFGDGAASTSSSFRTFRPSWPDSIHTAMETSKAGVHRKQTLMCFPSGSRVRDSVPAVLRYGIGETKAIKDHRFDEWIAARATTSVTMPKEGVSGFLMITASS